MWDVLTAEHLKEGKLKAAACPDSHCQLISRHIFLYRFISNFWDKLNQLYPLQLSRHSNEKVKLPSVLLQTACQDPILSIVPIAADFFSPTTLSVPKRKSILLYVKEIVPRIYEGKYLNWQVYTFRD